MSLTLRNYVALAICLASAAVGAVVIQRGSVSVSAAAFFVAFPWLLAGKWLAGDFARSRWQQLNKSMSAIYDDAKGGKLPHSPPLARAMTTCGTILAFAGVVCWFF